MKDEQGKSGGRGIKRETVMETGNGLMANGKNNGPPRPSTALHFLR
jgi:hypothetical protein